VWFTTAYSLVSGRDYLFRVRATNAAGNSAPSNTTSPRAPGVPSEPEDVRATEAGARRITLRWERPLSDGGNGLRGYTIEYSTDSGVTWTVWPQNTLVEGCTCQYMARTVTDLTDGIAHVFRIRAFNAVGTSQASEITDPMTPLTPAAPGQPTNLTASAMPAIVELDWDSPVSDGGAPITDYVVEFSVDAGDTWTTFADGTSTATLASLRRSHRQHCTHLPCQRGELIGSRCNICSFALRIAPAAISERRVQRCSSHRVCRRMSNGHSCARDELDAFSHA